MDFTFTRRYRGPIRAAVVDLAGTMVDYGSCAPAQAFVELFSRHGITVSVAQAREFMGTHKRSHIQALVDLPAIRPQWQAQLGRPCTREEVDALYAEFIPLQVQVLEGHSRAIPGAAEFVADLQGQGVKVAATTGYNAEMIAVVLAALQAQGIRFDAAICADDVPAGRPAPWLIYRAMEQMGVYPPEAVVAVGDTLADIAAALNAGVWAVGVARTGNMLGLGEAEVGALPGEELRTRLATAHEAMYRAGAHMVVDGIGQCEAVIRALEDRLARGETP